jgi:hypothetical protein
MPVSIRGTGGGSVTLDAGAAASATTLTLPNTTGTIALTASPTFSGTLTATTVTSPASTALTIQSAGTTAMTIDTSQNVGIGTSSPSAKLVVSGYSSANSDSELQLTRSSSGTGIGTGPGIRFNDGTTNNTRVIQNGSGALQFWHYNGSWQQEMTLDSSGNLLVGMTTALGTGINSSSNFYVGSAGSYWKITNFSATYYFNYNGSDKAAINGSTGAYTALSDANKKKDFEASIIGLAEVMQLQPKLFRMLDDADDAPKQLGFIAQEVQPLIPQAYSEQDGPDGQKFIGLQDRPIIAALTKAIQELSAKNDALEAANAALEARLAALEAK